MAGLPDIRDVLAGTLRDVDAIARNEGALRTLYADLQAVNRTLDTRLKREAARRGGGSMRFSEASALAYQAQCRLVVEAAKRKIDGVTQRHCRAAEKKSIERTAQLLDGLGKHFGAPDLRAAAELTIASRRNRGPRGGARPPRPGGSIMRDYAGTMERYGETMVGKFEEVIRRGLLRGATQGEMIDSLCRLKGGVFREERWRAVRIVRTEVAGAYNGARFVELEGMAKKDPTIKKKIIAVLDKRTAKDSIAVNGQVRPMSGLFMDGAGRQYLYPPARPNDRETIIPWRDEWKDRTANKTKWERAVLGELSPEEEAELLDRLTKIQNAEKKSKDPKAKKPKAPPTPMQAPALPPTIQQRAEAAARKTVTVRSESGVPMAVDLDGQEVGRIHRDRSTPGSTGFEAFVKKKLRGDYGGEYRIGPFVTRAEAEAALIGEANARAARGGAKVEKWELVALDSAVDAGDTKKVRRMVRGALHDAGVMPRDAYFEELDTPLTLKPDREMPDANGTHAWGDGQVTLRESIFKDLKSTSTYRSMWNNLTPRENAILVAVHEELHGATPYKNSWFYMGSGASIEEVTVEMGARKVTAKLTGTPAHWGGGAYQKQIDQVAYIVADETGRTHLDEVWPKIAAAGLHMRRPGATTFDSAAGILDAFVDSLDVPASAKPRIRARLLAEVKAPK